MSNPEGIGGFKSGQSGNPAGRPRTTSRIQLAALQYCIEAVEMAARIMRDPQDSEKDRLRLAAINTILDRGIGKPVAAVNLDLTLNKPLEAMSREELLEFRERYAAVISAAPALIGNVIGKEEEIEQPPLGLDELDEANGEG